MECKSLRESGDEIRRFDAALFAASTDTSDKNRAFAESLELDYPILSDPTKEVARAYGVLKIGLIASRHTIYIGPKGEIRYIDRKVSAGSAGSDLAARLVSLGALLLPPT